MVDAKEIRRTKYEVCCNNCEAYNAVIIDKLQKSDDAIDYACSKCNRIAYNKTYAEICCTKESKLYPVREEMLDYKNKRDHCEEVVIICLKKLLELGEPKENIQKEIRNIETSIFKSLTNLRELEK